MKRLVTGIAAGFLACGAAAAEIRVVASIAPVHSLVASVMQGVAAPELLVPSNVSEHEYAMKPSDARRIAEADLVVWIGESLEAFLADPLANADAAQLELMEVNGMNPLPYGAPEQGEASPFEKPAARQEDFAGREAAEHARLDPHVWLDPVRTQTAVRAIAARLAELDPANAAAYQANGAQTVAMLELLDRDIRDRLAPLAERPFVTFHDGYSYFVDRYGLNQVGQFTVDPQRRPGAATIKALRDSVASEGVACVFAEPQYDDSLITSLVGSTDIRRGQLDATGAGLKPGPGLYESLIRSNVQEIETCLSSTS